MDKREVLEAVLTTSYGWCGSERVKPYNAIFDVSFFSDGNHLEIGSLWGGSALVAAMARRENGKHGVVYCVDPMIPELYEPCSKRAGNLTPERMAIMPEVFAENMKLFGVEDRVVHIRKKSQPFPEELEHITFSTAYLDGWHYGNTPRDDVRELSERVDDFIIINASCHEYYPSIEKAFRFMVNNKKWILRFYDGRCSVFGKRLDYGLIWNDTAQHVDSERVRLPERFMQYA